MAEYAPSAAPPTDGSGNVSTAATSGTLWRPVPVVNVAGAAVARVMHRFFRSEQLCASTSQLLLADQVDLGVEE